MQAKYEVPIIPQNLRREETIVQIGEAVKYLSDVSTDIFKRINERVSANNSKISTIHNRIDATSSKLLKLAGAKKATQAFSSSKYPASERNDKYKSVFSNQDVLPMEKFSFKYKNVQVKDEPLETLRFFHVKVPNTVMKCDTNGLGKIPSDVDMVNDLMLYNSGKNLYNKYTISDALSISHNSKKESIKDPTEIAAAPLSISDRNLLTRNIGESYFYSPNLGNVPAIDVPVDLPDLPGIADDLRYTIIDDPGIAPSVTTTPIVPDLPAIIQDTSISSAPQEVLIPKVIPTEIHDEVEGGVSVSPKTAPESEQLVVRNVTTCDVKSVEVSKEPTQPAEVPGARASLMEAIRKAGGAKQLKSTELNTVPLDGPRDLMADLHAKLSMRRKGISGNKSEAMSDPKSAMDKVSAMIPPPPNRNDEMETTEDDDWED